MRAFATFHSFSFVLFVCALCAFAFPLFAHGQTAPRFLVSWKVSDSYAPSWYGGRVLPTRDARIDVRFDLVRAGRVASLSQNVVRWYVNGELVANEAQGFNLRSLVIKAPSQSLTPIQVRIVVLGYQGGDPLDTVVTIPLAAPDVVVDGRYTGNPSQSSIQDFFAYPFFFHASRLSDLVFSWAAFDKVAPPSESPSRFRLTLDSQMPVGLSIPVSVVVSNTTRADEVARKQFSFIVR